MEITKTTVGVIAACCVAAGAAGTYLLSTPGPETTQAAALDATAGAEPTQAVQPAAPVASTPSGSQLGASPAPPSAPTAAPAGRPQAAARASAAPVVVARSSSAPSAPANAPATTIAERTTDAPLVPVVSEPTARPEPEPAAAAEPQEPEFEELVVSADSVIGLQIDSSTTSERAEVEDEVIAHVTRDVKVDGKVAIPAGSKVLGEVTLVERGGRLRERARLGVRFTTAVLANGTRVRLESGPIYREGDAPSRESAAKIGGGAVGGAIIGGILGGAKGAAIGGSVGAGAGTAAVLAGGRNAATLPSGTPVTIRLTEPTTVTVDRQ
jgi:hypothetical protein